MSTHLCPVYVKKQIKEITYDLHGMWVQFLHNPTYSKRESIRSLLRIPALERQNLALISTISREIKNKIHPPIQKKKKRKKKAKMRGRELDVIDKEKGKRRKLLLIRRLPLPPFSIPLFYLFFLVQLNFGAQ